MFWGRAPERRTTASQLRLAVAAILAVSLSGCSSFGAGGPATHAVIESADAPLATANVSVVDLTDDVARQMVSARSASRFSDIFGDSQSPGVLIGPGDVLEVSLWEAPPAVLFGSPPSAVRSGALAASQGLSLPGQTVDSDGMISVPFAGSIRAAGRTPSEIERELVVKLRGKAHQPQAVVRLARNQATNVTVVGDVANSGRVPLTPKGESLLDVLAQAGGVKNPVSKTMIQLTRGDRVASMPLETVIRDPHQNIVVRADDIITAVFQPYSFTALGATGNNAELPFEATGINLAQALGRVGGLKNDQADIRGVFIFRFEDPTVLGRHAPTGARTTPDGKLPVIYRLDLKDPRSFFVSQSFPVQNRDVLYVSKAPLADLQKFMNMVSSVAFSVIGVTNAVDNQN